MILTGDELYLGLIVAPYTLGKVARPLYAGLVGQELLTTPGAKEQRKHVLLSKAAPIPPESML